MAFLLPPKFETQGFRPSDYTDDSLGTPVTDDQLGKALTYFSAQGFTCQYEYDSYVFWILTDDRDAQPITDEHRAAGLEFGLTACEIV